MKNNIERENAIEFIEFGLGNITKDSNKFLNSSIFLMFLFAIPLMIFGGLGVMILLILGVQLVALTIFNFKIKKNIKKRKIDFILACGLDYVFTAEASMLCGWKFFAQVYEQKIFLLIILILIFIMPIVFCFKHGINKVNNGMNKKKNAYTSLGFAFFGGMGVLGMSFGKDFLKDISQDSVLLLMGTVLVLIGTCFSIGSNYVVRYYLCRKYNISSEEIKEHHYNGIN